jgi:hypothetical protein
MVELVGLDVDPATKLDDGSAYDVYRQNDSGPRW